MVRLSDPADERPSSRAGSLSSSHLAEEAVLRSSGGDQQRPTSSREHTTDPLSRAHAVWGLIVGAAYLRNRNDVETPSSLKTVWLALAVVYFVCVAIEVRPPPTCQRDLCVGARLLGGALERRCAVEQARAYEHH